MPTVVIQSVLLSGKGVAPPNPLTIYSRSGEPILDRLGSPILARG